MFGVPLIGSGLISVQWWCSRLVILGGVGSTDSWVSVFGGGGDGYGEKWGWLWSLPLSLPSLFQIMV